MAALSVNVACNVLVPPETPLPLIFSFWNTHDLTVCIANSPLEDEATRLPLAFSLWAASPAFSGWSIGADGRLVYSPGGYFRWLGI